MKKPGRNLMSLLRTNDYITYLNNIKYTALLSPFVIRNDRETCTGYKKKRSAKGILSLLRTMKVLKGSDWMIGLLGGMTGTNTCDSPRTFDRSRE
jgi:hypothetical protein